MVNEDSTNGDSGGNDDKACGTNVGSTVMEDASGRPAEEPETNDCPCEEILYDAKCIECLKCKVWWHASCVGLVELTKGQIGKLKTWVCPLCYELPYKVKEKTSPKVKDQGCTCSIPDSEIENNDGPVTAKELRKNLAILQEEMENTVKSVVAEENEKLKNSWGEKIEEKTGTWATLVATKKNEMDKLMVEQVVKKNTEVMITQTQLNVNAEHFEKQKRKRNIVIRNVPESPSDNNDERDKHDRLFLVGEVALHKDEIIKCYRVGTRTPNKNRPLICVLPNEETVNTYTNSGSGMKFEASSGTEYWVNKDLTQAEQLAAFHARQARRERTST